MNFKCWEDVEILILTIRKCMSYLPLHNCMGGVTRIAIKDWRIFNNSVSKVSVINNSGTFKWIESCDSLIIEALSLLIQIILNKYSFRNSKWGQDAHSSIKIWCTSSIHKSLNKNLSVSAWIVDMNRSFKRNSGDEQIKIVISGSYRRQWSNLESCSRFFFAHV